MFFRIAALLFAALVLSSPALASPNAPPPQSAAQSRNADSVEEWLAEIARWSQGYDILTTRRVETMDHLLTGAELLIAKLETGSTAEAQRWVSGWAEQSRERLADETAFYATLSTEMPAPPAIMLIDPAHRARLTAMELMPDRIGGLIVTTGQSSEEYIQTIEAAAGGRAADLRRIDPARLSLLGAQLEAEIAVIEGMRPSLVGPHEHFANAQIAGNRALIAWLSHNKRVFSDQPSDPQPIAARIRSHADEARGEVQAMHADIDEFEAMIGSPEIAGTGLGDLMVRIVASMRQSADVEEQMAGAMDQLAAALVSGEETADDRAAALIQQLAARRIELDAERRTMMAADGA